MSAAEPVRPSMRGSTGEPSNVEALAAALAPLLAPHLAAGPAPLIDAEAAAVLLGVPKSWVLAEAREGRIPHVRLGKYVRFDRDELTEWLAGRRTSSGPVTRAGRSVAGEGRTASRGARGTNGGTECP